MPRPAIQASHDVPSTSARARLTRGVTRRELAAFLALAPSLRVNSARAREVDPALRDALRIARDARSDIADAREALKLAKARADALPLRELDKKLKSAAARELERSAETIDAFVSSAPLEDWEQKAWKGVKDEEFLTLSTTERLPMARRPNDFLCAVFSCYNDPRAPPSTDALLSLRLTKDGVAMGLRGDPRITFEGMEASLDDVLEKIDAWLALAPSIS